MCCPSDRTVPRSRRADERALTVYCLGMAPLRDVPPESRREVVAAVAAALGIGANAAETIVEASEPLWDAMEEVGGLVDSWGGGEFCGIFPRMVAVVRAASGSCGGSPSH